MMVIGVRMLDAGAAIMMTPLADACKGLSDGWHSRPVDRCVR